MSDSFLGYPRDFLFGFFFLFFPSNFYCFLHSQLLTQQHPYLGLLAPTAVQVEAGGRGDFSSPWHLGEENAQSCRGTAGRRPPLQPAPGNALLLTDGIFPKLLLQFIFINWLN